MLLCYKTHCVYSYPEKITNANDEMKIDYLLLNLLLGNSSPVLVKNEFLDAGNIPCSCEGPLDVLYQYESVDYKRHLTLSTETNEISC